MHRNPAPAVAALSAAWLVGCASTLPVVDGAPSASPMRAVQIEGASGMRSPAQSGRLVRAVGGEGRRAEFERQLSVLLDAGETLSAGNELELLVDGPASFAAMFAALDAAQHSILIESYIFEAQDYGERIAATLLRKRAEGLSVHVIYDSVGSFATPAHFFERLRAGGVMLCEFNPVSPLRRLTGFLQLNHRDHRKVLVVDERVGFTGGINISSVYSSGSFAGSRRHRRARPADEHWRDTHVRIEGPAVRAFVDSFRATWARQGCAGEVHLAPAGAAAAAAPQHGERLVAVIDSPGDADSTRFYRVLLGAINAASTSIHITMAYFVPDPQLLQALRAAARRGVEVVLVLPGRSDSVLVLRAGQAHYAELMAAGVRIHEQHDVLLHAKTAVIDGVWTTIGSSNLDWRSFLHNDELNVVIVGREFGAAMESLFARDVEAARALDPAQWETRGIGRRMLESFANFWEFWL